MKTYVADFETTTNPADCRVWAYAICEVGNEQDTIVGTTIDDFMKWCMDQRDNPKVLFHNLKFDGQFIMDWLFKHNFKHTVESRERASTTFNTMISDKGLYYQIEVVFYRKGKNIRKVTFQDSLKLIPLSVDQIAKSFKMPISKLSIDYDAHNDKPYGSPLSQEEIDYIKHDVQIVAKAVQYFYSQGLDKMTIGSCALEEYKKLIHKKNFKRFFPEPKYHADVKQSYRGGFTYLNPKFASKVVDNGIVLDVNSLYPSVMYESILPFGTPIFFNGKYQQDKIYPLYTQMLRCQFELKPGKIPTIQIKHSYDFKGNEYLESSNGEEVVLCLNNIDLDLFFDHYEVYNVEYISGWKFKATKGLFNDYVDKWSKNKIQAKADGNHGLYLISKLFLNSLYGKFGTDTRMQSKIPFIGEDGAIHYKDGEPEERKGIYIAMASFITSYARLKTISSAQRITDDYNAGKSKIQFVYADTDSLHCISPDFELPGGLDIDPYKLGAWKFESKFNKAKFLRQKCYIENSTEDIEDDDPEYDLKITVAGMPKDCYKYVNFDNFKIGASYAGKKSPKIVPGGVVLQDIDFTIKA